MNRYKRYVDDNVNFKTSSFVDLRSKRKTHNSQSAVRAYPLTSARFQCANWGHRNLWCEDGGIIRMFRKDLVAQTDVLQAGENVLNLQGVEHAQAVVQDKVLTKVGALVEQVVAFLLEGVVLTEQGEVLFVEGRSLSSAASFLSLSRIKWSEMWATFCLSWRAFLLASATLVRRERFLARNQTLSSSSLPSLARCSVTILMRSELEEPEDLGEFVEEEEKMERGRDMRCESSEKDCE